MKTLFKILFLMFPILGFSLIYELPFVKQKKINKAYFVNPDAGINIDNSYGNITISTWDENKIELDILIKVSGNNEKWVNKRIDDIDVKLDAFTNLVTAKTIIGESDFYNNGNNNSMEINYNIKIPRGGSIKLINKYGNIFSSDIYGNSDINCKYGKIILSKMIGNNTKIEIGYCPKSVIEYIKTGNISAKYSELSIIDAGNLNLNSDYTDVNIGNCQNLIYDSDYGKLKIEKSLNIKGSGDYMSLIIGEIFSNLKIDTSYSKIIVESISEKANNIFIESEFSEIKIGYNIDFVFDFDLSNKYGNIKTENDLDFNNKEITNNSKQYNGFYKKKGINKVKISSSYGNFSLLKTIKN
jgi:hypothetical protein